MITKRGKLVAAVGAMIVVLGGIKFAGTHGLGRKYLPSFLVPKVALDDDAAKPTLQGDAKTMFELPSTKVASLSGAPEVRVEWWAWNSQMGCNFANGGPLTTKGSLMEKQGIKMSIKREDDNAKLGADLTALATQMHDKKTQDPTDGVMFTGIMGDGSPSFLRGLNNSLIKAYGPDYRAEIIGSCGFSRGEDALWGPEEWKSNPQTLRGSVIAGVVRDGDWNIGVRYAGDNSIPVNADETTYDPDAMNFVNTKDYVDAGEKYIQGYCESRKVIKTGKLTGESKKVCLQGFVSWTPVDVNVAKHKGGVVKIVSTKEYANQMPHVIIGIHAWDRAHREVVEKMLTAFLDGGNQVLTFPKALDRASEISQEIYQDKDFGPADWEKYYKGVSEKDATGQVVELGGSKANNLADNLRIFGLLPGSSLKTSTLAATYTVFGNIAAKMYPKDVGSPMPIDSVIDVSYLRGVQNSATDVGQSSDAVTYIAKDSLSTVVGKRAVAIQFALNSDQLAPVGEDQLKNLMQELQINTLNVIVEGHTDASGNMTTNQDLSQRRANTVKNWLEQHDPNDFPKGRVNAHGFGSTKLLAGTSPTDPKNRRVEILIGQ